MSSGALPRTIVQLDHWSGLQLLIVAGYQPGCSTFRLLHNNATHLVLQAVSNTNTQIHKYINTNATKNTMQLLIVAGYSTFRPFHRDKTLHAALNTVQLKQCVCSLNSVCVADGRLCTLLDNSCYTSRVSHVKLFSSKTQKRTLLVYTVVSIKGKVH